MEIYIRTIYSIYVFSFFENFRLFRFWWHAQTVYLSVFNSHLPKLHLVVSEYL